MEQGGTARLHLQQAQQAELDEAVAQIAAVQRATLTPTPTLTPTLTPTPTLTLTPTLPLPHPQT